MNLKASHADCHADYTQRLVNLESDRAPNIKEECDPRVVALEKATADLTVWRPDMEGVLDDIHKDIHKQVKNLDRQVFDEMSHRPV